MNLDEIRARADRATPAILSMHREMLDIYNGNFSDRDPEWFCVWIGEWFNTIKQFWPFEDIPALIAEVDRLTAQIAESQRREKAAAEDLAISSYCRTCKNKCDLPEKLSKRDNTGTCGDYEWRGLAGEERSENDGNQA